MITGCSPLAAAAVIAAMWRYGRSGEGVGLQRGGREEGNLEERMIKGGEMTEAGERGR